MLSTQRLVCACKSCVWLKILCVPANFVCSCKSCAPANLMCGYKSHVCSCKNPVCSCKSRVWLQFLFFFLQILCVAVSSHPWNTSWGRRRHCRPGDSPDTLSPVQDLSTRDSLGTSPWLAFLVSALPENILEAQKRTTRMRKITGELAVRRREHTNTHRRKMRADSSLF